MPSTASPTVQRRRLGLLLRNLRGQQDLTAKDAGAHLERSDSWVSRVESGETGIRITELRALMDVYKVIDTDARSEMEDLARGGRQRGWWSKHRSVLSKTYAAYIGFEAEARKLFVWQSFVITGLLQTEDYARVVLRTIDPTASVDTIERRVQVRMRRQELLGRDPDPVELCVVLDEAVLHRVIGGDHGIHLAQLDHLLHVARDIPHVRIQVIPFEDASNPGMLPAFVLLQFDGDPEIGYVELETSDVYEEGEDAKRIRILFNDLRAAALSEARTISLIKKRRDDTAQRI